MTKNTGTSFEDRVFKIIQKFIQEDAFMLSNPNLRVFRNKSYFSKDRNAQIKFDISVEKYMMDPDSSNDIRPSIIVIIECKDYSKNVPVDDVEEFHSKLQQIGSDNTKGIIITSKTAFQRAALSYAEAKGIALARIKPYPDNMEYIAYQMIPGAAEEYAAQNTISALTQKEFELKNGDFFSSTGAVWFEDLFCDLLDVAYIG